MTECTMCGDCCDPVWFPLAPADLRQSASTGATGPHAADLGFAARHWHATGATRDGLHAYACDHFDDETRLCTAHDERPPICRGYPWYDGPPRRGLPVLPTRCVFRADIC